MDKIILYGAGQSGRGCLQFMKSQGLDDSVYAFCDSDKEKVGLVIDGKKVVDYEEAKEKGDVFVITVSSLYHDDIKARLENDGVKYFNDILRYEQKVLNFDPTEIDRAYCAIYHLDQMDSYFDVAENDRALDTFWGKNSPFYSMFRQLNLESVIELACGRGRHVDKYYCDAKKITLVDILEKNICICKKRFKGRDKISYYVNNGFDLSDLPTGRYTALFTYDAMVHFDMFDIYNYLKETYRVLEDGGMGLFHHSNIMDSPSQSFVCEDNPGSRNFMSKKLFAYLSYKAGFDIIEQNVIDWSQPAMDCITLVRKQG